MLGATNVYISKSRYIKIRQYKISNDIMLLCDTDNRWSGGIQPYQSMGHTGKYEDH